MLPAGPVRRGLAAYRQGRARTRRAAVGRLRRSMSPDALPVAERWALAQTDHLLARRPTAAVAAVVATRSSRFAQLVQLGHPAARVTAVQAAANPSLHAVLAASGPFLAIVITLEVARESTSLATLFRTLLFHLETGGKLIITDAGVGRPAPHGMWPLLSRVVALRDATAGPPRNPDEKGLAAAVSTVTIVGRRVVVTRSGTSLAKLREPEVDLYLRTRGITAGRVLEHIAAQTYESRATIVDHREDVARRPPVTVAVPPLSLREYQGAVVAPRQITVLGNVLLPDTYRHHLRRRLMTSGTTEVSPLFAQVNADLSRARVVDFPVYQLDSEWSGHFGHLMTEQLSRLWGWPAAKARHPDLRAVVYKQRDTDTIAPWERGLFESAGIDVADVLVISKPIRPTAVLAATPMFSQPEYASPHLAATWDRVGRGAGKTAGPGRHRRVFLTRATKGRQCRNIGTVEQLFRDAGFAVVLPETLPFVEQAAMLRDAEVVAGFAGSAMFTLSLCDTPKRVLLVCSEGYLPHNEYLIAAVRGHRLDIFWSVPDTPAANAPFRFDVEREGRHLRRALDELGTG